MDDEIMPCGCSSGSCYCDGDTYADGTSVPDERPITDFEVISGEVIRGRNIEIQVAINVKLM